MIFSVLNQLDNIKQETIARRRSFERLVPLDRLINAYWQSTNEFELADCLEVTVEYLFEVLEYYRKKYGVLVKDNILINFSNGIQILKA